MAQWIIDPVHSEVKFKVKHLVIATVPGQFKTVSGTGMTGRVPATYIMTQSIHTNIISASTSHGTVGSSIRFIPCQSSGKASRHRCGHRRVQIGQGDSVGRIRPIYRYWYGTSFGPATVISGESTVQDVRVMFDNLRDHISGRIRSRMAKHPGDRP